LVIIGESLLAPQIMSMHLVRRKLSLLSTKCLIRHSLKGCPSIYIHRTPSIPTLTTPNLRFYATKYRRRPKRSYEVIRKPEPGTELYTLEEKNKIITGVNALIQQNKVEAAFPILDKWYENFTSLVVPEDDEHYKLNSELLYLHALVRGLHFGYEFPDLPMITEKVLERFTKYEDLHFKKRVLTLMGNALRGSKKAKQSLTYIKQALDIDPTDKDALYAIVLSYGELKLFSKADQYAAQLFEAHKNDVNVVGMNYLGFKDNLIFQKGY